MKRVGAVYIMANRRNGTIYVGVTSDLQIRVWKHREGVFPKSFTARYGCRMLVYYRGFDRIEEAIDEEKRLKGGGRVAKLRLIESMNPDWRDLWDEVEAW